MCEWKRHIADFLWKNLRERGPNKFLYDCLRAVDSQQTRGRFLSLRMRDEDGNTLSPAKVRSNSECSTILFATRRSTKPCLKSAPSWTSMIAHGVRWHDATTVA